MDDQLLPHAVVPVPQRCNRSGVLKMAIWTAGSIVGTFAGAGTGWFVALIFNGMNGEMAGSTIKVAMIVSVAVSASIGLLAGMGLARWFAK